jgi:hypothetical protein
VHGNNGESGHESAGNVEKSSQDEVIDPEFRGLESYGQANDWQDTRKSSVPGIIDELQSSLTGCQSDGSVPDKMHAPYTDEPHAQ